MEISVSLHETCSIASLICIGDSLNNKSQLFSLCSKALTLFFLNPALRRTVNTVKTV